MESTDRPARCARLDERQTPEMAALRPIARHAGLETQDARAIRTCYYVLTRQTVGFTGLWRSDAYRFFERVPLATVRSMAAHCTGVWGWAIETLTDTTKFL